MISLEYNPDPFAELKVRPNKDFTVKTEKYTFVAHVGRDFIGVGGKDKSCVQISPSAQKLMWVESDREGRCEVNGLSIGGDATVGLAHLALTILRKYEPHVKELELEDSSNFKCRLPDNTVQHMNLNMRDALIYGKTFYERKFNAVELETNYMEEFRNNRRNPQKKPVRFDFKNKELQSILQPLYDSAETWAEFIHAIYVKYGAINMCAYIYPWYKSAFYTISGHSEPPFRWRLFVWEQPDVPYTMLEDLKESEYWKTVVQPVQRPLFYGGGILRMPYTQYELTTTTTRKTRRVRRTKT